VKQSRETSQVIQEGVKPSSRNPQIIQEWEVGGGNLSKSSTSGQGGFSRSDKVDNDIDKLIDKIPTLPRSSIYF
jgi:hypothetical protein